MRRLPLILTTVSALSWAGCTETPGTGDPDAGTNNNCALPQPEVSCTAASCSAATGTKTFGQAEVASGKTWLAVAWTTSEVYAASDTRTLYYALETPGGLTARRSVADLARSMDPALATALANPQVQAKLAFERELRAITKKGPVTGELEGTAIRAVDLLPSGAKRLDAACSVGATSACADTELCVIPEGMTAGTCSSMLTVKFYGTGPNAEDVTAQVVKATARAAIAVDTADAARLSMSDAAELLRRFEEQIAPRDHQLFGEPLVNGKDRDGNGKVLFFVSSRVGRLRPNLVGYFFPDDMRPTADVAHSNAADLLYLEPPGANVSMDALAGTIAHEYQHLINFSSKVLRGGSDQEEVWLDEGLATFAEDVNGYGVDAFANIGAFLSAAGSTSLTGNDSLETRGFAHLVVRYLYEQAGGASFSAAGEGTDKGGIAAIKSIVSGAETGVDALLKGAGGRTLQALMGDVMTTVALDGASDPNLTCTAKYRLGGPETDAFTNGQRGLHLRGPIPGRAGTITLTGPSLSELTTDGSAVPLNGGELVELPSSAMERRFSVGAASDDTVGLRIVPKP